MADFARAFGRRSVLPTPDFKRIRDLPRRTWAPEQLEALAADLTDTLKTPKGTMRLRPIQALALHDIGTSGGLLGPIRVGGGKTLTSALAPYVLESRRPLLLLPAALVEKTGREFQELGLHWRIPRNIKIVSYEMLGRAQSAESITHYKPDLIIADECHRLKNRRAACTRRVVRYMREHPNTKFVGISGTILGKSLADFAHIAAWCLKDSSPVPHNQGEIDEWAAALDEKVNPMSRLEPGVLLELPGGENATDDLQAGRQKFQRRLVETPGVVASGGDSVACSLYVEALEYTPNDVTDRNFGVLRSKWETPDGWALSEAVEVWRHARELALGLHYVWDPRPPESWLNARRDWAKFVRETLSHSRTLDTELQVRMAVRKGALDSPALDAWERIAPSFTPRSKALWHDTAALDACKAWMARGAGIVWVEHTFFAERLSEMTGAPYFGAQGKDRTGRPIESVEGAIIASVAANCTGRNLQKWSRNLVTSPPAGATTWEQLIGRTHRDGQTSDEVEVEFLFGCFEHFDAITKAVAGARMTQDTMGHTQKLLLADLVYPPEADVCRRSGARWSKVPPKNVGF